MIDILLCPLLSRFERTLKALDHTNEPDQRVLSELEQDPLTLTPSVGAVRPLRQLILEIQQICDHDALLRPAFVRELKAVVQHAARSQGQPQKARLLLFVHGIFSSGYSAFGTMDADFSQDQRLSADHLVFFDYDYNMAILENGQDLANRIAALGDGFDVILICPWRIPNRP